jgi:uncharacterized protein
MSPKNKVQSSLAQPLPTLMKKQLKLGITAGIVGVLLLSYSCSVQSAPPFQAKNPSPPRAIIKPTAQGQKLPLSAQITISGQIINLEVARTPEEQSIGLMNRTDLARDQGMLFVFSPPRPVRFWMKNTLIPLDMVFMSNGLVKYIGAQILPCKEDPCKNYGPEPKTDVDAVIELRGGRAAELRLKVGDRLAIRDYSAKKLK